LPLGGLNATNMATYLANPNIAAIGGSWLAPKDLIKSGSWKEITKLALEATTTIKAVRG
jgi:2-dehydro-3-deoxyphosphogluconate aldolase/(4S)-4-hydroxy-2-oxoglutarate aldolase